jgi:hypothetical protein
MVALGIWVGRVFLEAHRSSKRIKRMNQLQAMICSTQYTPEQRREAMDELMNMSLRR